MCSLTNCSERESVVTPPGLEPGSTGCQTCALTATPKSLVQWHGSQRAYSTVGTITSSHCPHLREAHPCASRTQTSLTHTPIMLLPSRAPQTHKCFTTQITILFRIALIHFFFHFLPTTYSRQVHFSEENNLYCCFDLYWYKHDSFFCA